MNWYCLAADRALGKSLPETGYQWKYVNILRAVDARETSIKPMDYVTRSEKFAVEHAEHQAAVTSAPQAVLKAMVKAADVYEAYNPGEYFYNGPVVQGVVIYSAKPS